MSDPQWIGARYELLERLGGGADGAVWRGWDLATGADCVARFVQRDSAVATGLTAAARWGQVIRTLGTISCLAHPGIVVVDDIVADEGRWALISRLIPGESLEARLASTGELPTLEAVRLVAQLCDALAVAHEAELAHGRVKPSNLLLEPGVDGTLSVRLTDFGLTELESWAAQERYSAPHPAAAAARVRYRPPEWIPGMPTSAAGDVYATGVVLYEALTGRLPFAGAALDQTTQSLPESLPSRPPDISDALWALLTECLEKRPRLRPTAAQVADRLRAIAAGPRLPVPPAVPPVRGGAHERRTPNAAPPPKAPGRHREASALRRVEFAASATAVALVGSLTFTLGGSHGTLPNRTVPTQAATVPSATSAAGPNTPSAFVVSPSATPGAGVTTSSAATVPVGAGTGTGTGTGTGIGNGPVSPSASGPATVPVSAPATGPVVAPSTTAASSGNGLVNDPIGYLEHMRSMIQQMAAQGPDVVDANAAGDLENLVLDLENGVRSYQQNGGRALLQMIKAKMAGFDARLAQYQGRGLISAGPAMMLAVYLEGLTT